MSKTFKILISIIFGLFIIIGIVFLYLQKKETKIETNFSCYKIEEKNILGSSMYPTLTNGEKVKGLVGYYNCNEIKRGEMIILEFQTREETFVKRIIGLPGDSLEFTKESFAKLNGEVLKNSQGQPYLFSSQSQKILSIPLESGKISQVSYFILGEEQGPATFDSRQFGFVEKDHLKGKVITK